MHKLNPITPLGATDAQIDSFGAVTLSEVVSFALASVAARAGHEDTCRATLKLFLGGPAPDVSKAIFGEISCFWTGPDQWFVEAPFASHEDLATLVKEQVKNSASVTEQTDGWCRFDLEGKDLNKVLELLCPVNLHNFNIGNVTRTTIEHTGCFLVRRADDHFSIIGPRSSAGSLHHGVVTAIKSAV